MTIGMRLVDRDPDGLAVFRPGAVCDVCTTAQLAQQGVVETTLDPSELHASCRGNCTCRCAYAQGGRCNVCARTRPAQLLADGQCTDRSDCADTLLAVR